jgi:hypothetical protein
MYPPPPRTTMMTRMIRKTPQPDMAMANGRSIACGSKIQCVGMRRLREGWYGTAADRSCFVAPRWSQGRTARRKADMVLCHCLVRCAQLHLPQGKRRDVLQRESKISNSFVRLHSAMQKSWESGVWSSMCLNIHDIPSTLTRHQKNQ